MSKLNTLQFFEDTKKIVVADNDYLPPLNGSNLIGIVNTINNKFGNVKIQSSNELIKINNSQNDIISIDLDIPSSPSLLVQLNGNQVIENTYQITYVSEKYQVYIKHNLNARVIGFVYDQNDRQAFYGVDYIDDDTVVIQFDKATYPNSKNIWKVSLGIGGGLPIRLSTQIPSQTSTNITVTSSLSLYNFVKNQIRIVNEDLEQLRTFIDESFQSIDNNFQSVSQQFFNIKNNYDNQINRLDGQINDIKLLFEQMGQILDQINGTTSKQ